MIYRSEIDGLRAIAVLPVILFHAGFSLFSGGFIGVDIFFVISGYLITSIIINDLEKEKFSLLNFYERRSRRILPALFLICLISIPFAWFWMSQPQIIDFSQSLIAVGFFVSNFLFWRESGYFDTSVDEKPLLHTWSLAVEEQYYIVFPILLILLWGFGRKKTFWVICILAAVSLIISEWGSRAFEIANFYLAPSRAWELFSGSLAAFFLNKKGNQKNNYFSLSGLVAIIFSIFYFDQNTPFPSIYTLIPVIGTLLIIIYGSEKSIVAYILSSRILVGIGLISYSLYLWHQPLFAFARIKLDKEPSILIMLCLIFINICLAYLSWKYVERPFRMKGGIFSQKKFFILCLSTLALIISVGVIGSKTSLYHKITLNSFEKNQAIDFKKMLQATKKDLSLEMSSTECHIWVKNTSDLNFTQFSNCQKKFGKALIVLGDSHAMNFYNILSYTGSYKFIIAIADGGCRPYMGFNKKECHYLNFEKFLQKYNKSIGLISFHQSGSYFIADQNGFVDSDLAFEEGFGGFDSKGIQFVKEYLEHLSKDYNITTIWIGPFLEYRREPENFLSDEKNRSVNLNSINLFKALNPYIHNIVNSSKIIKFFPFDRFFWQPENAIVDDCFIFRDKDHYSRCGEKLIGSKSLGIKYFEGALLKYKISSIYLDIDKYYNPR